MYIDDKVHFYLDLENKGEIESRYYLQPSKSLFSNCFKFSQTDGVLQVKEKPLMVGTLDLELMVEQLLSMKATLLSCMCKSKIQQLRKNSSHGHAAQGIR